MQRGLLILIVLILLLIQYRLWVGDNGMAERTRLKQQIAEQQKEIESLKARNKAVAGKVQALKQGAGEIEARAREELGLIKDGETYYLMLDEKDLDAKDPEEKKP